MFPGGNNVQYSREKRAPRWLVRMGLVVIACAIAGTAFAQSVVDRAKQLLREGKAKEAYELLEPNSGQLNDAESAYLLGIAALDSGKPGLAVIALERSLSYDANFTPARAELVRALLATGETDQARLELQQLQAAQVPPEVRQKLAALDGQLAQAAELSRRKTSGIQGYVEAEFGWDSNINTGSNSRTVAIPLFGGATATLDQVFTKKASAFAGIGGGAVAFKELQPGLRIFGGLDLRSRYNFEKVGDTSFEMNYWAANAGVRWQNGGHTLTGATTFLENHVGGNRLDEQFGFYGQYQYQLDSNNEVGLFGQWLDQKHPIQRSLDTELTLIGVGWRRGLEGEGTPILSLAAYVGDDREQGNDPAVGRRMVGGRIGYERRLELMGFGTRLITSLAYQKSRYKGENIFFFTIREDRRTDAAIGLAFTPWKDWTVTPQYVYTRNDSNIPVIDFSRHQLLVTLRRDFY